MTSISQTDPVAANAAFEKYLRDHSTPETEALVAGVPSVLDPKVVEEFERLYGADPPPRPQPVISDERYAAYLREEYPEIYLYPLPWRQRVYYFFHDRTSYELQRDTMEFLKKNIRTVSAVAVATFATAAGVCYSIR